MKILALVLATILALYVSLHLLFPILGAMLPITVGIWSFLIAAVAVFCITILLLFVFTGFGVILLGVLSFIWMVLAVIVFPVLLPILLPLFIVVMFISYVRKRAKAKE